MIGFTVCIGGATVTGGTNGTEGGFAITVGTVTIEDIGEFSPPGRDGIKEDMGGIVTIGGLLIIGRPGINGIWGICGM